MKAASGRILIADDEPHVRELLRDFLTGVGYEVIAVATGAEALGAVPTFPAGRHPARHAGARPRWASSSSRRGCLSCACSTPNIADDEWRAYFMGVNPMLAPKGYGVAKTPWLAVQQAAWAAEKGGHDGEPVRA